MAGFYLNLDGQSSKAKSEKQEETNQKDDIKQELQRKGFAKIRSETLGMDVFWIRDEYIKKRLPKNAVAFTLDELKELRGISEEHLKEYTIKKIFNAKEADSEAFLKTQKCEDFSQLGSET